MRSKVSDRDPSRGTWMTRNTVAKLHESIEAISICIDRDDTILILAQVLLRDFFYDLKRCLRLLLLKELFDIPQKVVNIPALLASYLW